MPNPTFFNLPEAKRKRLMDAVWQEFTTVSYMDASINKIIQTAEISRGSFYQYFSGKQDVFTYMLHSLLENAQRMFSAQLTVHNNDLFSAILGMYDMILWKNFHGRRDPLLERLHTLIRLNSEMDMSQFADQLNCSAMAQIVSELLARSGYAVEDPLECHALIHIFAAISMSNLTDTMRRPQNEERNRTLLECQLNMIRRSLKTVTQPAPARDSL